MVSYLLDTNHASFIIRNNQRVIERLRSESSQNIYISSLTAAELLLGVAKKAKAVMLKQLVDDFIRHVIVLDWTITTAEAFARMRSESEQEGLNLSDFDALIAGHAFEIGATLVTNDQAFSQFKPWLTIEDWT